MPTDKTFADLFTPEPTHWALRGDPCLWRELRQHLQTTPWPATQFELDTQIARAFEHPLATAGQIHLERFDHGGMSSGTISGQFWREVAPPLLRERWRGE